MTEFNPTRPFFMRMPDANNHGRMDFSENLPDLYDSQKDAVAAGKADIASDGLESYVFYVTPVARITRKACVQSVQVDPELDLDCVTSCKVGG